MLQGVIRGLRRERTPGAAAAFRAGRGDRWLADLPALARLHLADAGVDAVSGAQYNLNPTTVNVRLQPVAAARSGDNGNGGNATRSFVEELNKLDGLLEQGKVSPEEHRRLRTALIEKYQK